MSVDPAVPAAGAPARRAVARRTGAAAAAAAAVAPAPRRAVRATPAARTSPAGYVACLAERRTDLPAQPERRCRVRRPGGRRPGPAVPGRPGRGVLPAVLDRRGAGQTVYIVDAYDDPNAESDLATTARSSACRPAPRPTAASASSTSPADQPAAARRHRLGRRDLARPRHGLGDLPQLPHHADRGRRHRRTPTCSPRSAGPTIGAQVRVDELGRRRDGADGRATTRPTSRPPASSTPRPPATTATPRRDLPGDLAPVVAVGGTRWSARAARARLDRDRLGRRGQRLLAAETGSRPGRPARPAAPARATADVSAVADPDTGVAVYQTYGGERLGRLRRHERRRPDHRLDLRPGRLARPRRQPGRAALPRTRATSTTSPRAATAPARPTSLCTATAGWDGPTGLGTRNGLTAFRLGRGAHHVPRRSTRRTARTRHAAPAVQRAAESRRARPARRPAHPSPRQLARAQQRCTASPWRIRQTAAHVRAPPAPRRRGSRSPRPARSRSRPGSGSAPWAATRSTRRSPPRWSQRSASPASSAWPEAPSSPSTPADGVRAGHRRRQRRDARPRAAPRTGSAPA